MNNMQNVNNMQNMNNMNNMANNNGLGIGIPCTRFPMNPHGYINGMWYLFNGIYYYYMNGMFYPKNK